MSDDSQEEEEEAAEAGEEEEEAAAEVGDGVGNESIADSAEKDMRGGRTKGEGGGLEKGRAVRQAVATGNKDDLHRLQAVADDSLEEDKDRVRKYFSPLPWERGAGAVGGVYAAELGLAFEPEREDDDRPPPLVVEV